MPPDLLGVLRSRTRGAHGGLEQAAPLRALLANEVAADDYRRALLRLLGFHRWVAARLVESAADPETAAVVPASFLSGGRVEELQADLAWMGERVPEAPEPGGPRTVGAGLAEALGVLYVSEGSRLGGALIGRHLAGALGLDRERGLRFFLGGPPDDPSGRWREFCALLGRHDGRGGPFTERVALSAEGCFRAAHRFLAGEPA